MATYGVSVIAGGLTRCDPSWSRPRRFPREYTRIYVPTAGQVRFAVGEQWVDVVPGNLYVLPGQPHNRQTCERMMMVHWLHFTPSSPTMAQAISRVRRAVVFPEERWRWWRPTYTRIAEHIAGGGIALGAAVHAFALAVASAAIEECGGDEPLSDRERLQPALDLIERRFPEPVPVPALARAAGMSLAHFRRRFVAAFAASPRAYVARRRLEHAAELLADEDASVADVARACGYDDPFHFSRAFRRFHRRSPSELRRALRAAP